MAGTRTLQPNASLPAKVQHLPPNQTYVLPQIAGQLAAN